MPLFGTVMLTFDTLKIGKNLVTDATTTSHNAVLTPATALENYCFDISNFFVNCPNKFAKNICKFFILFPDEQFRWGNEMPLNTFVDLLINSAHYFNYKQLVMVWR